MRYILGVFAFIILAIMAVVLISSTTSDRSGPRQSGDTQINLLDYTEQSATFVFTTQGRIVSNEEFRSIRIHVSPTGRRIQVLAGYDNSVEKQDNFGNNQAAYSTFVHALSNAGYSRVVDSNIDNVNGACPNGRRYIYQMIDSGNELINNWSSTCGRRVGNFGGDTQMTQQLFRNQIPNYSEFTSGVQL